MSRIMRLLKPLFLLIISVSFAFAQPKTKVYKSNDALQKLVETEQSFARFAEQKGVKAAFLEFLSDDAIVFQPTETNAKLFWQNQPESKILLDWSPAWADISSDGNLGYTTGGWTLYPKGKTGTATVFGEYLTIWKKQSNGHFKAILDIGISHEKPVNQITAWKAPTDAGSGISNVKKGVKNDIFTDIFSKEQLSQGYFNYFADDVVVLRDGHETFYGKTNAFVGMEKLDKQFPPKSFLNFKADVSPVFGNMMYSKGVYQLTHKDNTTSSWNFTQIWKHRSGRWQIVADVFTSVEKDKR